MEEVCESGHKVKSFRDKIDKFWGCRVQYGEYSQQQCIVILKIAKNKS